MYRIRVWRCKTAGFTYYCKTTQNLHVFIKNTHDTVLSKMASVAEKKGKQLLRVSGYRCYKKSATINMSSPFMLFLLSRLSLIQPLSCPPSRKCLQLLSMERRICVANASLFLFVCFLERCLEITGLCHVQHAAVWHLSSSLSYAVLWGFSTSFISEHL